MALLLFRLTVAVCQYVCSLCTVQRLVLYILGYFEVNGVIIIIIIIIIIITIVGQNSVVSTATRYGLDGPGIESIVRTCPDQLLSPSGLLYNRRRAFPVGKTAGVWR
jgi:hypothetical protein